MILVAGVNNLTRLEWSYNGSRRIARPVFDNTPELVESLTGSFTDAKLLLTDAGFHCIICELTGLDVNIYNKGVTNYYKHQDIIDEAIPILNRTIYAMNYDNSLPTPFLQDSIHHKVKKTIYAVKLNMQCLKLVYTLMRKRLEYGWTKC